jgi:hemoglobin
VDPLARDRWMGIMEQALGEAALPADVVPVLRKYLADTATFMINRE